MRRHRRRRQQPDAGADARRRDHRGGRARAVLHRPATGSGFGASFDEIAGESRRVRRRHRTIPGRVRELPVRELRRLRRPDRERRRRRAVRVRRRAARPCSRSAARAARAPAARSPSSSTDAARPATPVAGATVGGGVTGADGRRRSGPSARAGPSTSRPSKAGAIRSNRLRVCVTDGADGACGTAVPRRPHRRRRAPGRVDRRQPRWRRFYAPRRPRELRGRVTADPSGLRAVQLRLTRRRAGAARYFSARASASCRGRAAPSAFRVGDQRGRWSYLLPGAAARAAATCSRRSPRSTTATATGSARAQRGGLPGPMSGRARHRRGRAARRGAGPGRRRDRRRDGRRQGAAPARARRRSRLKQRTVKVGRAALPRRRARRRCPRSPATRLGSAARLRRCGRDPRDAGGLYVAEVARRARAAAAAAGSTRSAAARGRPARPTRRAVRHRPAAAARPAGHVVLVRAAGVRRCQRTLEARPDRPTARPGEPLRVTVRGYDDFGHGRARRRAPPCGSARRPRPPAPTAWRR